MWLIRITPGTNDLPLDRCCSSHLTVTAEVVLTFSQWGSLIR